MDWTEICEKIKKNKDPIPDFEVYFYYTSKSADFNCAIDNIFFVIDQYDPNLEDSDSDSNYWDHVVYTKNQLRSVLQEKFLPIIQKSCDLDDSFFQPKINLDRLVERSYKIVFAVSLAASEFLLVNFI